MTGLAPPVKLSQATGAAMAGRVEGVLVQHVAGGEQQPARGVVDDFLRQIAVGVRRLAAISS